MKDKILTSYLNDFISENSTTVYDEATAFEHFANYCIVSREHPENFNFENVSVGGTDDLGIDGIAVLVNEHLVMSKQEIDFFKSSLRRLDAQFFFIQSKTSAKFSASDIGNFIFGVKRFFGLKPPEKVNTDIRSLLDLKEHIYESSIDMDSSPICHLFYVSTGKWVGDKHVQDRIDEGVSDLKKTDLFSEVMFSPIDIDAIKSIYKELKLKVTKEINFEKHTILPPANGVREAYIGILPCKEYLKLITDGDGNLLRRLFYDNVRDFQGNNPVNREINDTLNDQQMNDKFALFNNGITIVAESINKVGASFRIKDYQIVNGCQTSHILYRNRKLISEQSLIPLKIIVTDDAEVTNLIIKSTNRQSEVKIEAFESLLPFQKTLEEFYTACSKECGIKLYYERRSKQYEHLPINKSQIISLSNQVICFVAMFLNEPHSTHRYYGELLDAYRGKLFIENHSPFPYYLSGFALYIIDNLFRSKKIDTSFRKFKYQLLTLFRIYVENETMPYLNSKKIEKYCSQLHDVLLDERKAIDAFKKCIDIIHKTLLRGSYDQKECCRLRAFTNNLIETMNEECECNAEESVAKVGREQGTVRWFSNIRGYGFIENNQGDNIFVHFSNIQKEGYRTLLEGDQVEYTVTNSEKGFLALNVVPLDE